MQLCPESPPTLEPAKPTSITTLNSWYGDDNRWKIVVFWDHNKTIEDVIWVARSMAENIWNGTFSFFTSTDLTRIDQYLKSTVIKNPKLLVSLMYLVTQDNVDSCLASFMSFLDRLPGFTSSSDLRFRITQIDGTTTWEGWEKIFQHSDSWWELERMLLRHEPKSRASNSLLCGHLKGVSLRVNAGVNNALLDRYSDIGKTIITKMTWTGPIVLSSRDTVSNAIINQMWDYVLFGEE